jgi:hypothetical protein
LLEVVAREQLMKTQQARKKLSGCCGDLWPINPFTNPYPVYSHLQIVAVYSTRMIVGCILSDPTKNEKIMRELQVPKVSHFREQ